MRRREVTPDPPEDKEDQQVDQDPVRRVPDLVKKGRGGEEEDPAPALVPANRNQAPVKGDLAPDPAPVKGDPAPAPEKGDPAPAQVKRDPALTNRNPTPVKGDLAPDPAPVKGDPAPALVKGDPAPALVKRDPNPKKGDPAPALAKRDPNPKKGDPAPAQVNKDPALAPVNRDLAQVQDPHLAQAQVRDRPLLSRDVYTTRELGLIIQLEFSKDRGEESRGESRGEESKGEESRLLLTGEEFS
jgi:hypothetical protein